MTWEWLAGFIDGEGTLSFNRYVLKQSRRRRAMPLLVIYQNDEPILLEIAAFLGMGSVKPSVGKGHRYDANGQQLLPVLTALRPHLRLKQRHADLLIEFINCCRERSLGAPYDDHCIAIDNELRVLNRHGHRGEHNQWSEAIQ